MIWAPASLFNIIKTTKELDSVDPLKVKSIYNNISRLEHKISSKSISVREMKICLQLIHKNISILDVPSNDVEIEQIKKRIANLFSIFREASFMQCVKILGHITPPPIAKLDPVLNLLFLCDIDSRDSNGAIFNRISVALKEQVPFVTTKSLISGSDAVLDAKIKVNEGHQAILKNFPHWNIYKKGEFCVFIPKAHPFNANELGFNFSPEDQVKSTIDLFEGATGNAAMQNFPQLFKPFNGVSKRIILNGHGNQDLIGGLNLTNYHKLIRYLHDSQCQLLEIHSCYGGSLNVFEHHFDAQGKKTTPSFPILIRSIGSFQAHSSSFSDSYRSIFENMDKLLNKPGNLTMAQFKNMAKENNQAQPEDFVNFMQVKLPHSQPSLGGFKPLGEDDRVQIISYIDLRGAEINKADYIEITNKKYIDILPEKMDVPLKISQTTPTSKKITLQIDGKSVDVYEAPVLLSMIPGNAHHLISKIKGSGFNLIDFFNSHALVYGKSNVTKAFFIGSLELETKTYSNVVMEFSENFSNIYYSEGDPAVFYQYQCVGDDIAITLLTEFEFCTLTYKASLNSFPSTEAIRVSSGGLENGLQFLHDLMHGIFWDDSLSTGKPLPVDYVLYDQYKQNPTPQKAEILFSTLKASSHQLILEEAIANQDEYLVNLILNKGQVDINKANVYGKSLLHAAILTQNFPIVKLLVEKGADLNKAYKKLTSLMLAIAVDDIQMVKLMLEHSKSIDFDLEDSRGWTALAICIVAGRDKIFPLVYEAIKNKLMVENKLEGGLLKQALDQQLNRISNYGFTLLSHASSKENVRLAQGLLRAGADPYAGKPSCLSRAIVDRNKRVVEYWLLNGIDVTKKDSEGNSALDTACEKGTLEIFGLILKQTNFSKLPDHARYFQKTLSSFNFAKAMMLHEAGASFELTGNKLDSSVTALFEVCLQDPTLKSAKQFVTIFHKHLNLFDDTSRNLLMMAYDQKRPDVLQVLIERGANVHEKNSHQKSFLSELIEKNDAETIKLCSVVASKPQNH